MTTLNVLLAVAGLTVTMLVVAGMILVTPRGAVDVFDDETDPQGAELSQADAVDPANRASRPAAVHIADQSRPIDRGTAGGSTPRVAASATRPASSHRTERRRSRAFRVAISRYRFAQDPGGVR